MICSFDPLYNFDNFLLTNISYGQKLNILVCLIIIIGTVYSSPQNFNFPNLKLVKIQNIYLFENNVNFDCFLDRQTNNSENTALMACQ